MLTDNILVKELIENSDDVLVITDPGYRIRYVSSSAVRYYGVEPIKLLGQNIFSFVSPEKVEAWRECIATSQLPFGDEISLRLNKDRPSYFDVHISQLNNGQGLVIRLHDITSKKYREKELLKSNQQLDQVIYKTTHDLKAPIRTAMGLLNLAEKAPSEEKDIYLGLIKKSLFRLDSFIEEMNHFFRNEKLALQREKINIVGLLKEELENLHVKQDFPGLEVRMEIQGETEFYSDLMRVRTVLTNILSNAIKYSDPSKQSPFIRVSIKLAEDRVEIEIADNGIGIEPEYKDRIFDLFFRATNHSSGTGLGLFIVKDTIEKLKGEIDVQSSPGKGTSFIVRIPNQIGQPSLPADKASVAD